MTKIVLESKHSNSGYDCIVGNSIGPIITATHAAKIKHGTELEHLINNLSAISQFDKSLMKNSKTKTKKSTDFTDFKAQFSALVGTKEKRLGKLSIKGVHGVNNTEIDFVYVDFERSEIFICEMKSGSDFDTKKAKGETQQLIRTQSFLRSQFPGFTVEPKIVLWYIDDVANSSFKCVEGQKFLTNGRQFANLIACPYSKVNNILEKDIDDNIDSLLQVIAKKYPNRMKKILETNE
jgi:hypothetical protein